MSLVLQDPFGFNYIVQKERNPSAYQPSSCRRRNARPTATENSGPASLSIASRNAGACVLPKGSASRISVVTLLCINSRSPRNVAPPPVKTRALRGCLVLVSHELMVRVSSDTIGARDNSNDRLRSAPACPAGRLAPDVDAGPSPLRPYLRLRSSAWVTVMESAREAFSVRSCPPWLIMWLSRMSPRSTI